MKLYSGKIPMIGQSLVHKLVSDGDIESSNENELQLDFEAILKEHLRREREIQDAAKDFMQKRNLSYEQFSKVRRTIAEERNIPEGDEIVSYLATQFLECLMRSPNVDEVYSEDAVLRKKIQQIIKKHMLVDEEMDEEVRGRLKNIAEGTSNWEVEYQKVLEQIRRKHGL